MQQHTSHLAPTLTVLVKNTHLAKVRYVHNTGCQAHFMFHEVLVWFFIGKVCFLLPAQFCKAVDFTPALLYQTLSYNIS